MYTSIIKKYLEKKGNKVNSITYSEKPPHKAKLEVIINNKKVLIVYNFKTEEELKNILDSML